MLDQLMHIPVDEHSKHGAAVGNMGTLSLTAVGLCLPTLVHDVKKSMSKARPSLLEGFLSNTPLYCRHSDESQKSTRAKCMSAGTPDISTGELL